MHPPRLNLILFPVKSCTEYTYNRSTCLPPSGETSGIRARSLHSSDGEKGDGEDRGPASDERGSVPLRMDSPLNFSNNGSAP